MRTSSATNVGADKDSEKRQRAAIEAYAARARMSVVDWFYDPAVSGADPIDTRPGFSKLLDRIESNGVRVVLIEDATRFARDLVAQELGILLLIQRGVRVITAAGDDLTDTSDPSRVMMRQIAGAFAQYEKARLVARLRRAHEIKGKMGGRKSLAETRPEVVELAHKLHKPTRSGKQRSLREISAELAARGFVAEKTGRPFEAAQVSRMLEGAAKW
jgi:DNA invertase Pin-like site-specific DNA recombinase